MHNGLFKKGLGFVQGEVCPLEPDLADKSLKVPQIGWNALHIVKDDPLFQYIREGEYVYYVHSYYGKNCTESTLATSEYSIPVTGAVRQPVSIPFRPGMTVLDYCAGGGGKTPVMPNYLISETPRKVILRNFEGVITSYTQPEHYVQDCHCDVCTGKKKVEKTGVAWVAEGTKQRYLEPTKLLRNERHVKK